MLKLVLFVILLKVTEPIDDIETLLYTDLPTLCNSALSLQA